MLLKIASFIQASIVDVDSRFLGSTDVVASASFSQVDVVRYVHTKMSGCSDLCCRRSTVIPKAALYEHTNQFIPSCLRQNSSNYVANSCENRSACSVKADANRAATFLSMPLSMDLGGGMPHCDVEQVAGVDVDSDIVLRFVSSL